MTVKCCLQSDAGARTSLVMVCPVCSRAYDNEDSDVMSSQLRMQRAQSAKMLYGRDAVEGRATARIEIEKPAWGDLLRAVRSPTLNPTPSTANLPCPYRCALPQSSGCAMHLSYRVASGTHMCAATRMSKSLTTAEAGQRITQQLHDHAHAAPMLRVS